MITIEKLLTLTPIHMLRKACQTMAHIEADMRLGDLSAIAWVTELSQKLSNNNVLPDNLRFLCSETANKLMILKQNINYANIGKEKKSISNGNEAIEAVRLTNHLMRSLESFVGISPADWDFREPLGTALVHGARHIFPNMRVYLEDLRSPFNVGSIFRSADAFGVSEIILSGFTADPHHTRAERSAMGAVDAVTWKKAGLEELQKPDTVCFALELRGESIDTFTFPENGIVVVGSEELGVSPEAMALCSRTVSIPMLGAKGSLNAGVALGILLNAWRANLVSRNILPVQVN